MKAPRIPELLRLAAALVLVNALLVTPAWLAASVADGQAIEIGVGTGPGSWITLEAALVVGALTLLPRGLWMIGFAWAAAATVIAATVIGVTDVVFQVSLARPLNLFIDLYLVGAVYNLAIGNVGLATTLAAPLLALLVLSVLGIVLVRLLVARDHNAQGPRGGPPRPRGKQFAPRLAAVALVVFSALGLTLEAAPAFESPFSTPVVHLIRTQGTLFADTQRERARFGSELTTPDNYAELPGLLSGLGGRDVVIVFIESYGMAALEDPEFGAVVGPRLDTLAARAESAGVHLATGELVSPTQGGQSWYAHGTVISGLWLSTQLRYELFLASDRKTLVDDFSYAGYRTAALMPAITRRWPDGVRLGYDEVYTAANIAYEGPPLYWVTMPDQFTWSYLQRFVREGRKRTPLFVEAAMVSSHAPWTPVLPMIGWDEVGDGSRFEPFRQEGHPPEELWVDIDVLREQYAESIDYSLEAMTGYVEHYMDDRTLLIVMGDHQAAPWVIGAAGEDVPVHVFASDRSLLKPFLDWGFVPGAFPGRQGEAHRMDEFRSWFIEAFSGVPQGTRALSQGASTLVSVEEDQP